MHITLPRTATTSSAALAAKPAEPLQMLARANGQVAIELDGAGIWRELHGPATDVLGAPALVWQGAMLSAVCHPDDREAVLHQRASAVDRCGETIWQVHRLPGPNGDWRAVRCGLWHQPYGGLLVLELPRTETADSEARRSLELLSSASIDVLIRAALDGTLHYASPASSSLLGAAPRQLIGRRVLDLCHPDERETLRLAIRFLSRAQRDDEDFRYEDTERWLEIKGRTARLRARLLHQDGHAVWFELVLSAVMSADDRVAELVLVARDISRIMMHESELQMINESLELRIAGRTAEVEASNRDLREAMETLERTRDQLVQAEKLSSLGELVAGIAHEVNTPLGVGLTAASHLRERVAAFADSAARGEVSRGQFGRFVELCVESSQITETNLRRAAELIRSFKMVAADQSNAQVRRVQLGEYVNDVVLSLRPHTKGHVVEVEGINPFPVVTAPGPLSQVLTNFIMNAVRHAFDGPGGAMRIRFRLVDDAYFELTFEDDGSGIPQDHVHRIFDPFFTTQRGRGGTGLGLHIVYGIVRNVLRGFIDVASVPGEGTRFTLTLPIDLENAPERRPSALNEPIGGTDVL